MHRFTPYLMAANSTRSLGVGNDRPSVDVHGFLPSVSGTLAIKAAADGSGDDIVAATAVTAGVYVRIPGTFGVACAVVLAGGAAGTLFAV